MCNKNGNKCKDIYIKKNNSNKKTYKTDINDQSEK